MAAAPTPPPAAPSPGISGSVLSVLTVKKPHTKDPRVAVTLTADNAFGGKGTFTRSSDAIKFFKTVDGDDEIKFDGKDNVFPGADLLKGVVIFAEAAKPSAKVDDVELKLALSGGAGKLGPDATLKMTAIEVTLDICEPRKDKTTDPKPLDQPPKTAPAKPTDKFNLGRPLPQQNAKKKIDERAMLIVRQVKPTDFAGKLVLTRIDDKVELFADEEPKSGETALNERHKIEAPSIPADGLKLFVEGAKASPVLRDTGYRLGVLGVCDEADRVAITVFPAEIVSNKEPKDVKTVVIVPEKPARTSKSKFFPAPLIMGKDYTIELRPHVDLAKMESFEWSTPSAKITLTDDKKEVVKVKGKDISGVLDDVDLDLLLTTDAGKLKKRHKLTVVKVEMNSVTTGDSLKTSDDINVIKNPSGMVILTGGDADDGTKVPKFEITKIEPDLGWTDNDDRISWWIIGGEAAEAGKFKYEGSADFMNDESAKRGTKIQVFGKTKGDVLIQPYSGGFGYGMFRANVVPLHQVKYRVSRVFTKAGPGNVPPEHIPTASHADARKHIQIVNLYMRAAGIELIPDNSAEVAKSTGNNKVGLAALDAKVVAVTKDSDGHFDVEVNDPALTFGASASDARSSMRINTRNEIVSFGYIHSEAGGSLATARGWPTNHAPEARKDPPRAYTRASYTIKDKGVPSSSLISKTGIPPEDAPDEVKMVVMDRHPLLVWQGASVNRDVNLLWGASVPTSNIDTSSSATGGDATILAYGNTIAHELGHVFGFNHRGVAGDPFDDGLTKPTTENLMHPTQPPPAAENLDLVQVKALRFSEVLFRTP